ncbi:hypothetical protein [Desulforamulus ruminis]|uniref:hypothetical protein n=1 Tax=Desulforamulus ruminis TaxID=1564 RepID=UPI0023545733|nr:hypothetical protein [Desulforamulus ruminis]
MNQVEVFEGVVVRELVNPALQDTGKYIIGDKGLSGGLLKQPPLKFISLYKNLQLAGGWEIYTGVNMQGREKIFIHGEMFDPAAQYSVTYIALPEEFTAPCPDVQAELTVNLKTTVDSLVDELANVATKADVGINGIAMHLAEYATNAIKHDGSVPMISSLNFLGDQKGLNVKNGDSLSYCNIDFPELTTQDGIFRLFRMTNTTGNKRFTLQKGDGTFNVSFEILNGAINVLNGLYIKITAGSGSPEGLIVGAVGSIYLRTDGGAGTTLYVKQSGSGNTGWIAK